MELLGSNIKKIQETETPKKIIYISGNRNPKKASYILGDGTFQSTPRKFLILQKTEPPKKFLIFSQKITCSYVSGNGNSEKIPYISENATSLYFRK